MGDLDLYPELSYPDISSKDRPGVLSPLHELIMARTRIRKAQKKKKPKNEVELLSMELF